MFSESQYLHRIAYHMPIYILYVSYLYKVYVEKDELLKKKNTLVSVMRFQGIRTVNGKLHLHCCLCTY